MHRDTYYINFDATYSDIDVFLGAIKTEQDTDTNLPISDWHYKAAYDLCSEYVGFQLVPATFVVTYQVMLIGNYRLRPVRNYSIATVNSLTGSAVNSPSYMVMPDGVIIDRALAQTLTLNYVDTTPQLVSNAIYRQANVF